jgi:PDZ domain
MWLMVLWVCMIPLTSASAQVAVDTAESDGRVLAGLGDGDYHVRQAATRRLLSDDTLSRDDLDRLYAASETPEQRHRLLRVARHHVIRRMIRKKYDGQAGPGSMGLSHQVIPASAMGDPARTGVLVVMTLPGFPAYAALEPGDVIIDFAGQPLPEKLTSAQFPQLIRAHMTGEQVRLTVLRDGETLEVMFKLEHGQALGEVYDANGLRLAAAYRQAWQTRRAEMEGLVQDDAEADAATTDGAAATSE